MKWNFRTLLSLLICLPISANAGKDPIAWKLDHSFPSPVSIRTPYPITYTFTNTLPFQLVKPIKISKASNTPNEFDYIDHCSGVRLASEDSCTVTVSLTPRTKGVKQVQLTIGGYDNDQVPLPVLRTEAIAPADVVGFVSTSLPYQMEPDQTAHYEFTFTNHGKISISQVSAAISQSEGQINLQTNTCGSHALPIILAADASCKVSGTYTPTTNTPSTQSVSATLTYGTAAKKSIHETTTTIIKPIPAKKISAQFVGSNYLPPLMSAATRTYTVQALFTNVSDQQVTFDTAKIVCTNNIDGSCDVNLSNIINSCTSYLPVTAACQIQATLTLPASPSDNSTYTIKALLNNANGSVLSQIATAGHYVNTIPTTRTVTLVNQCSFPVWFSLNGSAVPGVNCNSQGNGCPVGTSCNTTTKACYWTNPSPISGGFQLNANGGTNSVTIPSLNYGGVQWSGNISASTLCNGTSSCGQASCENQGGSTACAPGKGFSQPATQAEITMNASSADSYDVEVINGFHIPISMTPYYYAGIPATANNYNCGTPGSSATANNFGACDWNNVTLPSPTNGTRISSGYYWVTNGNTPCHINSDSSPCSAGQLCGLYQNPSTSALSQTCGNFLGYWSADQVCSYSGLSVEISNFFKCNQSLPTTRFPVNSTLYKLMACSVPKGDVSPLYNSCYLSYPGATANQIATCCGCVDWWDTNKTSGVSIGSNPATQSCGTQIDPTWTQYVQPMVQWMKAACPSAYVYPFDDKTSGFSCTNNTPNLANSTGYTITFCDGSSGLPAGITEGRAP